MSCFKLGAVCGVLCLLVGQSVPASSEAPTPFVSVDIYIDSKVPVAAWQFEFAGHDGKIKVVGIENGASDVFGNAPYYDGQAISTGSVEKIIVADFSLHPKRDLPRGRFRIATLHLMIPDAGRPSFAAQLIVAADFAGHRIYPAISTQISTGSKQ